MSSVHQNLAKSPSMGHGGDGTEFVHAQDTLLRVSGMNRVITKVWFEGRLRT